MSYIFLLAIFLSLSSINGQSIPLTMDHWSAFNNDNNESIALSIKGFKGQKALHLKRHEIVMPNIDFSKYRNFTIEFDVAAVAMPGVGFHAPDFWNYEYVYLRISDSGRKTAIQYLPIYNGAQSWQLYNHPLYEGVATFGTLEWVHVKMEVYEGNMRLFIDHQLKPNLSVKLMHKDLDASAIFFKTTFREAYFANVSIETLEESFKVSSMSTEPKYLSKWMISEQFKSDFHTQRKVANLIQQKRNFRQVEADEYGLLNLAKFYDHPRNTIIAKTTISSSLDQVKELLFDYSSAATIVLNDQILFSGRELDSANYGLVEDGEEKLMLDLRAGENTLLFFITADDQWQKEMENPPYLGRIQAMNWGFMARLKNDEGIK